MAHNVIPRKNYKYVMVVVDHNTRRLVWAAPGRNSATVREFFDLLGPDRCAQITHVSADGADFIDTIVSQMCPAATRVADPFYSDVRIMPMWWVSSLVRTVLVLVKSA